MNIALIAHDVKKELMINFCIAYKGIMEKHNLYAVGTTGSIIMEASGLSVNLFSNGTLGEQQIIARLAYNEIDMVIFLRDSQTIHRDREDAKVIIQLCDMNNIPVATNIASAEMLIKSLSRGDLDWRLNLKRPD
jgi:methylglyoxal synthase